MFAFVGKLQDEETETRDMAGAWEKGAEAEPPSSCESWFAMDHGYYWKHDKLSGLVARTEGGKAWKFGSRSERV
jgi:hypothetical protein